MDALTGVAVKRLTPLSEDFPLTKPNPADESAWVQAANRGNLTIQNAQLQVTFDAQAVTIAKEGTNSAPANLPTVELTAAQHYSMSHEGGAESSQGSSVGVGASMSLLSGGATMASVSQAEFTLAASKATLEDTQRQVESQVKQAYLSVLSDISEVDAYHQAVVSNQASLAASRAAYQAGTVTIVDLLTQESDLLSAEQQYTAALYRYVTDSLALKQVSGILGEPDIVAINQHLQEVVTPKLGLTEHSAVASATKSNTVQGG